MKKKFSPWESGVAMLELAVLIPVILLLGFSCMEYARIFHAYEAMSSISREAARIPLIECETATNFTDCMNTNGLWNRISAFAEVSLPGAEVVITAYDLNATATPPVFTVGEFGLVPITVGGTITYETPNLHQPSKFDANYILNNIKTDGSSLLFDYSSSGGPQKKRMIVSEVFYPLDVVSPLAFLAKRPKEMLHEVTMY